MSEHRQNNSEPDSVLSPADHGRLAAPEEQNRKVKMENELAESIGERKDLCELQRVADRAEPLKKQRFVKVTGQTVALDGGSAERARQAAGFKGYVTNIDPAVMDGHAVVTAYHDLWRVEQSFRMAKLADRACRYRGSGELVLLFRRPGTGPCVRRAGTVATYSQ